MVVFITKTEMGVKTPQPFLELTGDYRQKSLNNLTLKLPDVVHTTMRLFLVLKACGNLLSPSVFLDFLTLTSVLTTD